MNAGGPAHHVSLLGGGLDKRGYYTLLITGRVARGEASLLDLAEARGARFRVLESLRPELNPLHDVRALIDLVRIVREFQPQIVHTHTAKAGFVGRLAALAQRPRPVIVHTYHGHVLEGYFGQLRTRVYRALERGLARVTDRLIGVSGATVDDLVQLRIAPRSRFQVIPLGLELEPFLTLGDEEHERRRFRDEIGAAPNDVLLVYVGRLVRIKRLDVLLKAVAEARGRGVAVRLAVVGDGEMRADLERLGSSLGLGRAVNFTGYRRDLSAIVASADIGVISSDNEGTPVSLIEMAAGARPLVATRVGGVPEVVRPECGLLVEPGDEMALADALVTLAGDASGRAAMGRAAREHARAKYSAERLVDDMDSLYEALLSK
jgi:glycosyltransferase involved in cell wall biosynthesis